MRNNTRDLIQRETAKRITDANGEIDNLKTKEYLTKGYADTIYVALTGDQSVAGNKTFTDNLAIASTDTSGNSLNVTRNLTATSTDAPVVSIVQDHTGDDQAAVRVQQDGTGSVVELYDGATLVLRLNDGGRLDVAQILRALTSSGIHLEDDGGNLGIIVEDGGNVGIKQSDPQVPLHVGEGTDTPASTLANVVGYFTRNGPTFIIARNSTADIEIGLLTGNLTGSIGTITNHPFTYRTNNTEHGALGTDGLFGFGLTSGMAAKVHILQATLGDIVQRLTSTATNDDPTEDIRQNRVATTDATVTTLHTFTVPASTTVVLEAHVVARRTGGASGTAEDGAGYGIVATFKNVTGTATQIGTTTVLYSHESQAAWDCVFDVTGATARVRVTGAANNNVTWHLSALRVRFVSS